MPIFRGKPKMGLSWKMVMEPMDMLMEPMSPVSNESRRSQGWSVTCAPSAVAASSSCTLS